MNDAFWRTVLIDTIHNNEFNGRRCSRQDILRYRKRVCEQGNTVEPSLLKGDCQFFVGEQGYIGIGPLSTTAGDMIYVVPGANLPLILRPFRQGPRLNTFNFLGFCYVHGIMDGEAVDPVEFRRETPGEKIRRWAFGGHGPDLELLRRLPEDIYLE